MMYLVNIKTKVVSYLDTLPAGHLIALKKVFEPQGYNFITCLNTQDLIVHNLSEEEHLVSDFGITVNRQGYIPTSGSGVTSGNAVTQHQYDRLQQLQHSALQNEQLKMAEMMELYNRSAIIPVDSMAYKRDVLEQKHQHFKAQMQDHEDQTPRDDKQNE